MKILMVLTSHDKLGDTGRKTGFWLEEMAAPYWNKPPTSAKDASWNRRRCRWKTRSSA
jgi:hypothetical protein